MKKQIKIKQVKLEKVKLKVKPKAKPVNPWRTHLSKTYIKMKVKNKSVKLSEAMKAAALTYKKKK